MSPRGTRLSVVCLACAFLFAGAALAAPLTEQDVTTLLKVGLDADVVVSKIKTSGVSFTPNDEILARFKDAGAIDVVLDAIKSAAAKPSANPKESAVTYDDVVKLLDLQIPEDAILKRLAASPTLFTLDAKQVEELKSKGASDRLLTAMQKGASPGDKKVEISDVAIILDCSASMEEQTADGKTKMEVARKVVTDLVNGIPDGLYVTFLVYGHDKAEGCKAVKVVRPLGEINDSAKKELADFIAKVPDVGNTPIALALETAGKELAKNDNYCGVVLVTDGKEGCHGDPAAVAKKLAENPKLSFGVNVVGFGLTKEETSAVESIAKSGKGKYYDAKTPGELTDALANVTFRLRESAKPAPKIVTNRRAFKVLAPKVELPAMKQIVFNSASDPKDIVFKKGGMTKYGEEVRLPSAEKFNIIFVPAKGMPVLMIKDFSIPDRRVVEIKPEDYLGIVKVATNGKRTYIVKVDDPRDASFATQRTETPGEPMVVPAGKYNIFVDGGLIEENFEVKAGQSYEL